MSFCTIFLNLCNFWNITVSQGSAATYLRCGGICNDHFVKKFCAESSSERILKIDEYCAVYMHNFYLKNL